jgi:hypothetical protein
VGKEARTRACILAAARAAVKRVRAECDKLIGEGAGGWT